jgi:hypothetical protein
MTNTATKNKIDHLFSQGYADFNAGLPVPKNRIKAMGWRQARFDRQSYDVGLRTAYFRQFATAKDFRYSWLN